MFKVSYNIFDVCSMFFNVIFDIFFRIRPFQVFSMFSVHPGKQNLPAYIEKTKLKVKKQINLLNLRMTELLYKVENITE